MPTSPDVTPLAFAWNHITTLVVALIPGSDARADYALDRGEAEESGESGYRNFRYVWLGADKIGSRGRALWTFVHHCRLDINLSGIGKTQPQRPLAISAEFVVLCMTIDATENWPQPAPTVGAVQTCRCIKGTPRLREDGKDTILEILFDAYTQEIPVP